MDRRQKEVALENMSVSFADAKALIFSGYRGLKVSEMNELRVKLRGQRSFIRVLKNRLAARVLGKMGLETITSNIDGPTAVAWSDADPAGAAKILVEFAKSHERFDLRGGVLEGKALSRRDVETLALLPSREVLIAKALGSMCAPATNFVGVLAALPRQLVTVIAAIRDKKQQ